MLTPKEGLRVECYFDLFKAFVKVVSIKKNISEKSCFLHTCGICSKLASNVNAMAMRGCDDI